MIDIHYRLFDVAHLMSKEIDSHHRIGKTLLVSLAYVALVVVLRAKILSETQCLSVEPSLLQLYQNNAVLRFIAFALANRSREINAEHRQCVARSVAVFMRTNSHMNHFFLQQGRQYGLCDALVLHYVLEHGVVNRVGNMYYHNIQSFNVNTNTSSCVTKQHACCCKVSVFFLLMHITLPTIYHFLLI